MTDKHRPHHEHHAEHEHHAHHVQHKHHEQPKHRKKFDKKKLAVIIALLLMAAVLGSAFFISQRISALRPKFEVQKGMCYVTWSKDRLASSGSDASLKEMKEKGIRWVALVPTWYQETCSSNKIFRTENTPSDESVIHAIKKIHALGMKVMIKPHLDLIDTSGGGWRGEICVADPDWKIWFLSYQEFVLNYAAMSQRYKVDIFCFGTELKSATIKKNDARWRDVIALVRRVYHGPITYAANWEEEFERVPFWDAVDYIGIDAYFPLAENNDPTLDDIKKGWQEWIGSIETIQKKYNKPVIFPEIGYCSAKKAAKTPWEDLSDGKLDLELQENCYRAFFEMLWDKDWFYGVYWWRWGTDKRMGGPTNRSFMLQGKPAVEVMERWYKRPTPEKRKFEEPKGL